MSEQTTYRTIYGAENYAMRCDSYVVNTTTGKTLQRYWNGNFYKTLITDDKGTRRWVNHDFCNVAATTELPDQEMVEVEGYTDYKITPWGAVWKYRNLAKKKRNSPFIVTVKEMSGSDYVRLISDGGKKHWVRVEKIMEKAYPND